MNGRQSTVRSVVGACAPCFVSVRGRVHVPCSTAVVDRFDSYRNRTRGGGEGGGLAETGKGMPADVTSSSTVAACPMSDNLFQLRECLVGHSRRDVS